MFQSFKKITFILFLIFSNASNANSSTEIIKNKINRISNEIKTGADNFEKYIPLLKILIKENCDKINKIISDYTVLVNYITVCNLPILSNTQK